MSVSNCPLHTHMKGSTSPQHHSFFPELVPHMTKFTEWPERHINREMSLFFGRICDGKSVTRRSRILPDQLYSLILWTIGQTVMIIGKEHFLNPLRIFETTISFRGKPGCQESHKCCQFSMLLPVVEVYNLLLYGNTSTRKWRTGKVLNGSITTLLQLLTSVSRPLSLLYPCTKDVP